MWSLSPWLQRKWRPLQRCRRGETRAAHRPASGTAVHLRPSFPAQHLHTLSKLLSFCSAHSCLTPASATTESTGVRTQTPATTACPARPASPARSPSAGAWSTPQPTDRCVRGQPGGPHGGGVGCLWLKHRTGRDVISSSSQKNRGGGERPVQLLQS